MMMPSPPAAAPFSIGLLLGLSGLRLNRLDHLLERQRAAEGQGNRDGERQSDPRSKQQPANRTGEYA
jgi:hypothetical protein